MMGTIVQAQLYTFSSRKAICRAQKLLKIADGGIIQEKVILVSKMAFSSLSEGVLPEI